MSAGKSRAFARKMMEYQQPSSSSSNNSNPHRPLSQRSSVDMPQGQMRSTSVASVNSSSTYSDMDNVFQAIADPYASQKGSFRSSSSRGAGGSNAGSGSYNSGHLNRPQLLSPLTPSGSGVGLGGGQQMFFPKPVEQPIAQMHPQYPLTEGVIDPSDFEVLVVQCPTEIADYPDNDLQVEYQKVQQNQRTSSLIEDSTPSEFQEVNQQVADCLHQYKKRLAIIHRAYAAYSPQFFNPNIHLHKVLRMLSMLPYEEKAGEDTLTRPTSSLFLQSQMSEAGGEINQIEQLMKLIKEDVTETVNSCREIRQLKRFPELMSLFMLDVAPPAIDRSLRPDLDQPVSHISVKCIKHDTKLNFEPLFFSVFLYDLKHRHKLSETFHFDRLEPWMFQKLKNHIRTNDLDVTTRIQEAIFSLSQPSDELYIVVRIEKILQAGDIQSACEPYMHVEKNLKALEKLKTQSSFWCETLGAYRMPFAWTATNLIAAIKSSESQTSELYHQSLSSPPLPNDESSSEMSGTDSYRSQSSSSLSRKTGASLSNKIPGITDGSGSNNGSSKSKIMQRASLFMKNDENFSTFLTNFHPLDLRFKSFFIQDLDKLSDEDIATCLSEFKKDRGKKFKSIDIELSLDIRPVYLPVVKYLTPDLQIINCQPAEAPNCKMILGFPVSPVAKPYSEYINLIFVYPKHLNLSSKTGTARNILMKVKLAQGTQHGPLILTRIFGRSTDSPLKDVALCHVNYHSKVPKFYEEIKIQLPATLGQLHHLLFEFYHITCNSNKREIGENETFVGATWLPLLDDNKRLVVGDISLPVSSERLPSDYYRVHPRVQLPTIKWLDGHKDLFSVSLKAHSSVHTMDAPLDNFLKHYSAVFGKAAVSSISKHEAIKMCSGLNNAIECLKKEVSMGSLIHFLHVTLDKLLSLVVRKQTLCGEPSNFAHNAFEALVEIVDNLHKANINTYIDGFNRVQLLLSYVKKNVDVNDFQYDSKGEKVFDSGQFQTPEMMSGLSRKTLHTELLIQIMSAKNERAKLMQRIWFFFEIVIKSLANENVQNVELGLPRLHSFDDCLNGDIGSVISNVTEYIYQLCKDSKDVKNANYLNFYLAFFVSDLFSVCNRFWVFSYIKSYIMRMNSFIDSQVRGMGDPATLISLKLEFLRVVSTHEHFVILNLPFYSESANMFDIPSFRASALSSVSQMSTSTLSADSVIADTLSVDFKQNHFLMGLLLQEFKLLLPSGLQTGQKLIVSILSQIAQFIDKDTRYNQPFIKAKVVALFLPLIKIVILNKDLLCEGPKPFLDSAFRSAEASSELESKKNKIAGIEMNSGSSNAPSSVLTPELTRNILSLFLWVFKNLDPELLFNWWSELSEQNLVKLFQVVHICVQTFEYRGREVLNKESIKSEEAKLSIEGFFFGNIGARNEMMNRRRPYASGASSRAQSATSSLVRNRWDKNGGSSSTFDGSADDNERLIFESNVCCETILVCLDLTDFMLEIVSLGNVSNFMTKECVVLLTDVLSRNQTPEVYLATLNLVRIAIKEHAQFVLLDDSELCAELCLRLLRISCMKDINVRAQATIVLYFIMRLCFDLTSGNSLSRLKIQLIVALSSLVNILDQDKAANLQKSIQSLSTYSIKDSELLQTSFPSQIEDLVSNLKGILLNTIKMHEFDKDLEMHMDLMYQVAKGYQSSIQLRLTWLDNMRLKHKEHQNFAEAAMCALHSAAFVCEGLYSIEQDETLPIGATDFEDISQNVLEECIFDYTPQSWSSFNNCLSKEKVVTHLEEAAKYFHKAQLFEFSIKCFERLIEMHGKNPRDYRILSDYNMKIKENCDKILNLEETGKRSFSTYFRVGFYGKLFEDLDGKEFVYKEAPYAQLSVISNRLEAFYQERFGQPNVVEILKSSNLVERNNFDDNKAYIQVTYVEPYFDYYRDIEMSNNFERNKNINEFVYNIPFTKSGRPHGGLKEQFKKRVVLKTEQVFPYLKTRLEVIGRSEEILTPIQVAKEDLTKKLQQFEAVLHIPPEERVMFDPLTSSGKVINPGGPRPVDGKRLQLILQGCIGTTVNQGPTEIALTFLNVDDIDADGDGEWTLEHDDLRLLFKKFIRLCKKGLTENRKVIKPDQVDYEAQLQKDFEKLKATVNPLLHNRGPGWISGQFDDLDLTPDGSDPRPLTSITGGQALFSGYIQQGSYD